jgi:hypothetical protein
MSTDAYMAGRKKYGRPQAVLFSNNSGIISDAGKFIPDGFEFGATGYDVTKPPGEASPEFLILSDDNRAPIDFKVERLENRKRMINGRMRSYYIGDKLTLNLSWKMLPSRSFLGYPDFDTTSGIADNATPHTTDGGAGGVEILRWYEEHTGPFYVYLAYDKYSNFDAEGTTSKYTHLQQYNQVLEMYISSFDYSVQKRGSNTDDFWDISMSLEEV